jgi:hypothetical protein
MDEKTKISRRKLIVNTIQGIGIPFLGVLYGLVLYMRQKVILLF